MVARENDAGRERVPFPDWEVNVWLTLAIFLNAVAITVLQRIRPVIVSRVRTSGVPSRLVNSTLPSRGNMTYCSFYTKAESDVHVRTMGTVGVREFYHSVWSVTFFYIDLFDYCQRRQGSDGTETHFKRDRIKFRLGG